MTAGCRLVGGQPATSSQPAVENLLFGGVLAAAWPLAGR